MKVRSSFGRSATTPRGYDLDPTDPEITIAAWVETAANDIGGMDMLYNNAAGFGLSPLGNMTLDLWRHVMRVELDIIFHTASVAWAYLSDAADRSSTPAPTPRCAAIAALYA